NRTSYLVAFAVATLTTAAAQAQNNTPSTATKATTTDSTKPAPASKSSMSLSPAIEIQHLRANDQRGVNIFEAPKHDAVPYDGFRLNVGAAFTQQFQGLAHRNTASPKVANNVNANQLMDIGHGFNNASANLYINAQLAPGIRVALTSYLSSRHHNETWVKDGYLLIDESPVRVPALENLMKYVTIRAGHFEINYGDAHFRRSDNGNAMYNPFVGNLVMDAFTTEVGAEVYVRAKGLLAMTAVTGGEIKGNILAPDDRAPAFISKVGFDRQLTPDVRVRLTGSRYANSKSPGGTLYAGDRAGSRYFFVLENTVATSTAQASSGLLNPQFKRAVTAYQINPFVKVRGLELFGVIEQAKGINAVTETTRRTWNQYSGEAVYRFCHNDKLFVAGRYNTAKGDLPGIANEVGINRSQLGAGWFVTPNVMLKSEWVNQKYNKFPTTDIRSGGKFKGFMVEGVVAF
ncbi:MAG: hypothetical protein ACT4P7_04325, partial [Gemmatimonadaceae bacterium]